MNFTAPTSTMHDKAIFAIAVTVTTAGLLIERTQITAETIGERYRLTRYFRQPETAGSYCWATVLSPDNSWQN